MKFISVSQEELHLPGSHLFSYNFNYIICSLPFIAFILRTNYEEINNDQIYGPIKQEIKVGILIHNLLDVQERLPDEGAANRG